MYYILLRRIMRGSGVPSNAFMVGAQPFMIGSQYMTVGA